MKRIKILLFLVFISLFSSLSFGDPIINTSNYFPATLKFIKIFIPLNEESIKEGRMYIDARLPGLKLFIKYKGKIRDISNKELDNINIISSMNTRLNVLNDTKKEILVSDNNEDFWVLIPNKLYESVNSSLIKNKEFTIYVIYIGHSFNSKSDRVFLLTGINASTEKPVSRLVYSKSLLDIQLGSNINKTLKILKKIYNEPIDTLSTKLAQKVYVFGIDKITKTILYVYDGGPEFRERVYALQLSTYNNSEMVFYKNLKLSANKNELESFFKTDYSFENIGDEKLLMRLNNSDCSFEIENNKLYSVYIVEDPFY